MRAAAGTYVEDDEHHAGQQLVADAAQQELGVLVVGRYQTKGKKITPKACQTKWTKTVPKACSRPDGLDMA